jgi:hypothetical protein
MQLQYRISTQFNPSTSRFSTLTSYAVHNSVPDWYRSLMSWRFGHVSMQIEFNYWGLTSLKFLQLDYNQPTNLQYTEQILRTIHLNSET